MTRSLVVFLAGRSSVCTASCPCCVSNAHNRGGRWASTRNFRLVPDARSWPPVSAAKTPGRRECPPAPGQETPPTNPPPNRRQPGIPEWFPPDNANREQRASRGKCPGQPRCVKADYRSTWPHLQHSTQGCQARLAPRLRPDDLGQLWEQPSPEITAASKCNSSPSTISPHASPASESKGSRARTWRASI